MKGKNFSKKLKFNFTDYFKPETTGYRNGERGWFENKIINSELLAYIEKMAALHIREIRIRVVNNEGDQQVDWRSEYTSHRNSILT